MRNKAELALLNAPECLLPTFQHISGFWTCLLFNIYIQNNIWPKSFALVKLHVLYPVVQFSEVEEKWGVDLTDHPWVMMMRGLLLLKPQEVRVCSCRGSSVQVSSPSINRLNTELLTYGSFTFRAPLCSLATKFQKLNSTNSLFIILFLMLTLHIRACQRTLFILSWIFTTPLKSNSTQMHVDIIIWE